MIDFLSIFTTGGLILWCKTFLNIKFETLINNLIKTILLDDKRAQEIYISNGVVMRWRVLNDAGLIFVVAYQEAYNVLYTDKLLDMVVQDFTSNQQGSLKKYGKVYIETSNYTDTFLKILKKWEKFCQGELENNRNSTNDFKKKKTVEINSNSNNQINSKSNEKSYESQNKNKVEEINNFNSNTKDDINLFDSGINTNQGSNQSSSKNFIKKGSTLRSNAPKSGKSDKGGDNSKKEPPKKTGRVWDSEFSEANKENIKKYDHSDPINEDINGTNATNEMITDTLKKFMGPADPDNLDDRSIDENLSDKEDIDDIIISENHHNDGKKKGGLFSRLTSSLKNYIGNKVLNEEDLEKVMKEFTSMLMEKNVAKEIAENLCNSVSKSLLNTKTQSFTTITTTVKEALKETIAKILTPKTEFDVLKLALAARKRGEPYKIVFIGVNGVGKSTNLAKVGYLLMNNGLKLLIAACDNFRSGAVEQLKTHSRALGVDLYDKGYKDDPAYIAKEAIDEARKKGYDCVLIDTAGRMQDNEPLMKSLAKLVEINQPDAILFVGEALTGNDSVDQLKKFNQALIDYSKKENPRTIDGILLTKFDTVDDKVGSALTMVYTTGKPIVYVGTGQKYTNLKKLNVNNVLNALFG